MNRKLGALAFFLCTVSLPTYAADWVRLTENTIGDTFFVDKSSLQRDGDSVTFWSKTNYNVRSEEGNLSSKVQTTINCRTREIINRYMMFYDDIDNRGRLTDSLVPKRGWHPIPPETVNWSMMLFACR